MKTLKLSSIAFVFLCLISSCTKDSSQLSSSTSSSNDQTALSARETILGKGGKDDQSNQGTQGKDKVVPEMTITFNPDPAKQGQEVTVTGTFIQDGTTPDCGKLQLMMSTDGENWTSISQEKEISASVQEVTGTFTPSLSGEDVYQFKLHYVSSGSDCNDYDQGWSEIFYLDVEACEGLTLTRELTGVSDAGGGLYQFTVVYTITTCGVEFDKLKLQGGLTNATSIVSADPDEKDPEDALDNVAYDNWIPGGSKNWIQRWVETSTGGLLPTSERKYTVVFTKVYSGSGPIELTGEWSVSLTKAGIEVDRKECSRINIQ
jgi:hypothetical protein